MGFQKHKTGIIVAVLCLLVLAATAWFCLFYLADEESPEGTFVEWREEGREGIPEDFPEVAA